jgi:hypothetical protein
MLWIFSLIFMIFLPLSSASAGEKILTTEQFFSRYNPTTFKMDGRGNFWASYYDLDGEFHVRNVTEDKDFHIGKGKGKSGRGFVVEVQDNNIYVAWREKAAEGKKVYFRTIYDGKSLSDPVLLDENSTEALTRIKIGADSKGNVFVAWFGERVVEKHRYHIYASASNDFGRTFSTPKNLTIGYDNSIYPTLLVDETNAYIFSYSIRSGKHLMIFRKTSDGGKTWTDPAVIKELEGTVTLFIEPLKVGKRLHVFWYTTTENTPMIEYAYSDDEGTTWKTKIFDETRAFGTVSMNVTHDSKNGIYLAIAGRQEDKKDKVYFLGSDDNGTTWRALTPLRHYPYENTRATFPVVEARDNGTVLIVWNDYRNIRRNLYMQYSTDYGRTWQEKDVPLEEPGKYNTAYWPYGDTLIFSKDKYYLLAYRFRDDRVLEEADLLLLDFQLKDGGAK